MGGKITKKTDVKSSFDLLLGGTEKETEIKKSETEIKEENPEKEIKTKKKAKLKSKVKEKGIKREGNEKSKIVMVTLCLTEEENRILNEIFITHLREGKRKSRSKIVREAIKEYAKKHYRIV